MLIELYEGDAVDSPLGTKTHKHSKLQQQQQEQNEQQRKNVHQKSNVQAWIVHQQEVGLHQ